ncbi:MAG TPA: TolC family protein [Longimicrobiaceae bacterium]|nr:TolC family protein [Longimicrobiaceae bacterium]
MHILSVIVWIVVFGGGLATTVAAQGAREMSVEEAVRLGLERNPRIAAADADAAGAEAAYREARAAGLPAIRTQASYTRLGGSIPEGEVTLPGFDSTFTLLPIELNRYNSEVSVEQPVFTGGRVRGQVRAASHEASSASLLAEQERVDIAFEVRRAYWTLFGAVARLETTDASIAYVEDHVTDVENRLDQGAVLLSDALAARTRRSEVMLDRVGAENEVRTAQLVLAQLTGLPLDTEIVPALPAQPEAMPPLLDAAGGEANRPAIEAMEEQVLGFQAQLGALRAGWLPELAVVGRYVYARPNPYAFTEQSEFRGTWEAGVALRWNPWEGGRQSAAVAGARERLRAAEARLQDAREQATVDVAMQSLEVRRATEAVRVAAEHVEQATESFRVSRDLFAEGVVLSAQVLEAEEAYRVALARRARAQAEYEIARAAVMHALGEI